MNFDNKKSSSKPQYSLNNYILHHDKNGVFGIYWDLIPIHHMVKNIILYWDYIEAWKKAFYYQNSYNTHLWFFRFKALKEPSVVLKELPH